MGSTGVGALGRALCNVLRALGFSSEWPCSVHSWWEPLQHDMGAVPFPGGFS